MKSARWLRRCVGVLWLLGAAFSQGQGAFGEPEEEPVGYGEYPIHGDRAKAAHEANLERYRGDENVLVLPGLVADRAKRRVEVLAEATGLPGETILEFLLVDVGSDRGYETLLWSFAKPSDVHRGLEFIGMEAGAPYAPDKLRFWPKGERVIATVAQEGKEPMRLERLVADTKTGKTLEETGFVFTGSYRTTIGEPPGREVYAADELEARSVASIYNDPEAVLDVPRRALKRELYGQQLVNPKIGLGKNEVVSIVLEPEFTDGKRRVFELDLKAEAGDGDNGSGVRFDLVGKGGEAVVGGAGVTTVLAAFDKLVKQGREPFVTLHFDRGLPVGSIQKVCKLIALVDSERGIRAEPPPEGQLFYRAFIADGSLMERGSRLVQPWELRLEAGEDGQVEGSLAVYASESKNDGTSVVREAFGTEVADAAALVAAIKAEQARRDAEGRRPVPAILLVLCPPELDYGEVLDFITPVLESHPIVHLFLDQPGAED